MSSTRSPTAGSCRSEEFFAAFGTEDRAVLDALLDKYAEHGIGELDDLHVLELPPLPEYGSPVEIAARFGGSAGLRQAVETLQELIYAA